MNVAPQASPKPRLSCPSASRPNSSALTARLDWQWIPRPGSTPAAPHSHLGTSVGKEDRSPGSTLLLSVNQILGFQGTLEQSLAGQLWREQVSGFDTGKGQGTLWIPCQGRQELPVRQLRFSTYIFHDDVSVTGKVLWDGDCLTSCDVIWKYRRGSYPELSLLVNGPSVCPVPTPWEPPPSCAVLPTFGSLSRLLPPKANQKPTFPVKGQTQSLPLPRCFPNGGHPLSTFCCNRHPWGALCCRTCCLRAYHSKVIA